MGEFRSCIPNTSMDSMSLLWSRYVARHSGLKVGVKGFIHWDAHVDANMFDEDSEDKRPTGDCAARSVTSGGKVIRD
jgi:hypothetical protein